MLSREKPEDRRDHERQEIIVENEAPRVELEARDHVLDVNHLRGDGHEVAQGPRVGRQGEAGVVRDVPDGAGEDDEEGEEGEAGGGRL